MIVLNVIDFCTVFIFKFILLQATRWINIGKFLPVFCREFCGWIIILVFFVVPMDFSGLLRDFRLSSCRQLQSNRDRYLPSFVNILIGNRSIAGNIQDLF